MDDRQTYCHLSINGKLSVTSFVQHCYCHPSNNGKLSVTSFVQHCYCHPSINGKLSVTSFVQHCFTPAQTVRTIPEGGGRAQDVHLDFHTPLLSSDELTEFKFKFNVALRPHKPYGLLLREGAGPRTSTSTSTHRC